MKKPFILNFGITPSGQIHDFSLIEYSDQHSINLVKGTNKPAISYLPLETETMTKVMVESSDSDRDFALQTILDTSTETRVLMETSDSDVDLYMLSSIQSLLDTETLTERGLEDSDSDRDV